MMTPDPRLAVADLIIIGGGAAGLAAAIESGRLLRQAERQNAHQTAFKVVLLEKNEKIGRKLLATGNGRCNLTNQQAVPSSYHGGGAAFVKPALDQFGVQSTLDFFMDLGLPCREEAEGRVYPACQQAAAVLEVLRIELVRLGLDIQTDCVVTTVEYAPRDVSGYAWQVVCEQGQAWRCRELILATGGQATSNLGSDGSGYRLAGQLGHGLVQPRPALVQLETVGRKTVPLAGIRVEAGITLRVGSHAILHDRGEVLLTDYGLSGIPILQLSGQAGQLLSRSDRDESVGVQLDLLPEWPGKRVLERISDRCRRHPDLPAIDVLTGLVHSRIGHQIVRDCLAGQTDRLAGQLTSHQQQSLANGIKSFTLTVQRTRDFSQAQVTAGGLPCTEFAADRLESLLAPGLFAAGELLDIDGDCGGFNLQWAWSSGRLAGHQAALRILAPGRNAVDCSKVIP